MTGYSILYLGRGDFASEYLAELETLPCCTMLARSAELRVPVDNNELLDIVLLEASPLIAQSGQSLSAQRARTPRHRGGVRRCAGLYLYR
jgi:hypothetical protein